MFIYLEVPKNFILTNLISNAFKYTPNEGTISIVLDIIGNENKDAINEKNNTNNPAGWPNTLFSKKSTRELISL